MNQKTAVYEATMSVLADLNIDFNDGDNIAPILTKDIRKSIIGIVTQGIMAKEVELSAEARAKYSDEVKVAGYVNGLVNNWHRKDSRFNGDTKYVPKNPGSRAGSGDTVLKNLKALRATRTDAKELAAIDAAIVTRKTEVGEAKAKSVVVDLAKIPAELKALLGLEPAAVTEETDETTEETDEVTTES